MATISQTISPIPAAGHRGVDTQITFVTKQEAFQDALQGTTVTQLNAFAAQANALRNEVNGFQATATTGANTATTQAGIATTKAGEASASATAAVNAKNLAEAAYDNFDDRYLGSKATAPTLDNDSNTLLEGALYWNSTSKRMFIWAGTSWQNTTNAVASTDNAIVRFDGTSGSVQNSGVIILDNNDLNITGGGSLIGSFGAGNIISNLSVGTGALKNNTTGVNNTATGASALQLNTTGYSNTATGASALKNNTTGYYNTALGVSVLQLNTTGYSNTAIGVNALYSNTTGNNNTATGVYALQLNTTGNSNTATGLYALQLNTTGNSNTATGVNALYNNTTGYSSTAIGVNALQLNTEFFNVSGLGYNAQVTASNQVQLGDSATTTYVYGTVQNRSDMRDKADIEDSSLGLDFISSLRPVSYIWDMREDYKTPMPKDIEIPEDATDVEKEDIALQNKETREKWLEDNKLTNIVRDGSKKRTRKHFGFIAQEVKALGIDFGGIQDHSLCDGEDVMSLGYDEFIAPMVKAIQELKAEIELLKAGAKC